MFCDTLFGPVRQWGFLVKDLDTAMRCWVEQLGVGPWWGYRNARVTSVFGGETTEVEMSIGLAFQNGVQIELIHQLNDAVSPYRAFYDRPEQQMLHQVAYFAPGIDAAVAKAKSVGMREVGYIESATGARFYYMDSPALEGLVIELMQVDDAFVADYERCASEAAQWDGAEPWRLVTF